MLKTLFSALSLLVVLAIATASHALMDDWTKANTKSGTVTNGFESLATGSGAVETASTTVFTVRILKYENGWRGCRYGECALHVYDATTWKGSYTTNSQGFIYVSGGQYLNHKPYFLIGGRAAIDESCSALNVNIFKAEIGIRVRQAYASSVDIYAYRPAGLALRRYLNLTARKDNPFSDAYYSADDPFGFEHLMGSSGYTLRIDISGPYDNPEEIGPSYHGFYHVWNIADPDNKELLRKKIIFTWAGDGKARGAWSIVTCASRPLTPEQDGYPMQPYFKNGDDTWIDPDDPFYVPSEMTYNTLYHGNTTRELGHIVYEMFSAM